MSLHAAAQHLSSRGRGPDNTLVHMSHGEVKSLNDLAMAHGGQLTINPDTGLPEAGFLSKLLPMIAGAGLMMVPGVGPLMAASLVGGGTAIATGDLKKGLMAGLGAYGGAGLGQSLMGAGAAAAPTAVTTAVPEAAASAIPEAAGSAASANPLAGLDMSGATTAGISPTAAPQAFTTPVAAPNPIVPSTPTGAGPLSGLNVSGTTTAGLPPAAMPPTVPSVNPVTPPVTATAQPNLATTNMEGHMYGGKPYTPFEAGFEGTSARIAPTFSDNMANMQRGFTGENLLNYATENPFRAAAMAASVFTPEDKETPGYKGDADMGQRYSYSADPTNPLPTPDSGGREQTYFTPRYTKISNEEAKKLYGYADGGITGSGNLDLHIPLNLGGGSGGGSYPFQSGGGLPGATFLGAPQASQQARDQFNADQAWSAYADQAQRMQPYQTSPLQSLRLGAPQGNLFSGAIAEPQDLSSMKGTTFGGNPQQGISQLMGFLGGQKMASGGLSSAASHLGDYSDGGRLLKGPGDGVSDSIPAMIGKKQPARLADGEFVVPARIVSELGNGSTEAGARKLYAMMDRVQAARKKSIGKGKVAKNSRADKLLPA